MPGDQQWIGSYNTTTTPPQWQIGYQYLGGVTNWNNLQGVFASSSPVKLIYPNPAGCWRRRTSGEWNQLAGETSTNVTAPLTQMAAILCVDGSVSWVKVEKCIRLLLMTPQPLMVFLSGGLSPFRPHNWHY